MTTIDDVRNEVEAYADGAVEAFKAKLKVKVSALSDQMNQQGGFGAPLSPSMIEAIKEILDQVS